ncbi:protein-disulfide reductase DsbD domain-containing protein [Roseibium sp. M-1]
MKRLLSALALTFLLAPLPARAAMTAWTEVQGGSVRLIATGPLHDGRYQAGLEFLLESGWHTYWRYPGEAGIPPQINTEGSGNLKRLDVFYPAPERYSDGYTSSIVYHDGIVLPIEIEPEDPAAPVHLSLEVFFGICNEICVPGEALLTLDLTPSGKVDSLAGTLIARDLEAVPQGTPEPDLSILSVAPAASGEALSIVARVPGDAEIDLFAAAPEGSFIGLPRLVEPGAAGTENGDAAWELPTKGLKTTDNDTSLRLVLKAGGRAIEHLVPIDPAWVQ